MRVLVAPDSFKGTFSATQVAQLVADGLRAAGAEAVELPLADGGEGTLDVVLAAWGAQRRTTSVRHPLHGQVEANWAFLPARRLALIESAQACGLHLTRRTPSEAIDASTHGVGDLILAAVDVGAERIIVTSGGSATTDGGAGALAAIGPIERLRGAQIEVLTDTTVPFADAARVFGPQKGADQRTVAHLSDRLDRLAEEYRRRFGRDPRGVARTGAAGGLSGALWAAYHAPLRSGADAMLDLVSFDQLVAEADAIVVGEGALDIQSIDGKLVGVVAARSAGKPVIAIVGRCDLRSTLARQLGIDSVLVAGDEKALRAAGVRVAADLAAGRGEDAHRRSGGGPSAGDPTGGDDDGGGRPQQQGGDGCDPP
ncbi:glycerate kinase [Dactylosporangium sp. CA-233914]|uniref:glycerate kinase n=1 Tax=Dactylosporangium sp. CA-233914 TaxID=3239934 RepID=UPI003D905D2F